jgi:hypothetical protein
MTYKSVIHLIESYLFMFYCLISYLLSLGLIFFASFFFSYYFYRWKWYFAESKIIAQFVTCLKKIVVKQNSAKFGIEFRELKMNLNFHWFLIFLNSAIFCVIWVLRKWFDELLVRFIFSFLLLDMRWERA